MTTESQYNHSRRQLKGLLITGILILAGIFGLISGVYMFLVTPN